MSTTWSPPLPGTTKANFDVALSLDFAVVATIISDSNDNIIGVATKKILTTDVALGEAQAALLAVYTAASCCVYSLILEGDALNVVLAIQQPWLFGGWNFSRVVSDISLYLDSFYSWKADKASRSAIFRAHCLAKWAASHLLFGSIPIESFILLSIWNRSGKNPPG